MLNEWIIETELLNILELVRVSVVFSLINIRFKINHIGNLLLTAVQWIFSSP